MESYYTDGGDFVADPNNNNTFWSCGRYYNSTEYVMAASKTTNSGTDWTRYLLTSGAGMAFSLAVNPTNSNIVYVGGSPDLFKTTNGGSSWIVTTNGITDTVFDIAINPAITSTIYAATPDGVFKTTNSGLSWSNTGCIGANAVLIDPDDNQIIYVGSTSGVYKSTVGGGSWVAMNDGLTGAHVSSLGINPATYLFAGTEDAAMFRWSLEIGAEEYKGTDVAPPAVSVFPNPAKSTTVIQYVLLNHTAVHLAICDVTGRHIKTLVNATQASGKYDQVWDGTDEMGQIASPGVYFCKLVTDTGTHLNKLVWLR